MEEVIETWVFRGFCRVSAALCHQVECLFGRIVAIVCLNYVLFFIMNRTMKSNVTAELTIPQQTRYLVPIELGRVERHVIPT